MTPTKKQAELPAGWTCEGQTDLTDLVEDEHIHGSMPAGDVEREAARQAFYAELRLLSLRRPRRLG